MSEDMNIVITNLARQSALDIQQELKLALTYDQRVWLEAEIEIGMVKSARLHIESMREDMVKDFS